MTNCAMMGADWERLTWWQYQALLSTWNDRHSDEPEAPPLNRERALAAMASVH